uniref:cell envelope integrity protein TolA n=1 Tax=Pseudomonas viridiflava TaxID=33069 RepID=UPI0013CE7039
MQERERSSSEGYFWPSIWAVGLHVLLFGMLFVSFAFTPELPPTKPIVQATLYELKSKSPATTQTNQKIAGEAKKTAAKQY